MRQALRVKFICKYIAETRKIPKLFYAYRIVFSKKKMASHLSIPLSNDRIKLGQRCFETREA